MEEKIKILVFDEHTQGIIKKKLESCDRLLIEYNTSDGKSKQLNEEDFAAIILNLKKSNHKIS